MDALTVAATTVDLAVASLDVSVTFVLHQIHVFRDSLEICRWKLRHLVSMLVLVLVLMSTMIVTVIVVVATMVVSVSAMIVIMFVSAMVMSVTTVVVVVIAVTVSCVC